MPANVVIAYPQGAVWDDAIVPGFAFEHGGTAPTFVTFPAGQSTGLYQCNGTDAFHWIVQLPHSIITVPITGVPGAITLRPHVHWTMVANPTAGQTLTWAIDYVLAKKDGTFASTVTTLTAPAYTTVGDEIRKHLTTQIGDLSAEVGPSTLVIGRLYLSAVPASQNPLVIAFDFHFQKGPFGTIAETA